MRHPESLAILPVFKSTCFCGHKQSLALCRLHSPKTEHLESSLHPSTSLPLHIIIPRVLPSAMASEVQKDTSNGNSLADRISKPDSAPSTGISPAATAFLPKSGKLWSDETDSPTSPAAETPPQSQVKENSSIDIPSTEPSKPPNMPQSDGATTPFNGSVLQESEYSVQIKLADLQADPNNPLYSVSTFEELNL